LDIEQRPPGPRLEMLHLFLLFLFFFIAHFLLVENTYKNPYSLKAVNNRSIPVYAKNMPIAQPDRQAFFGVRAFFVTQENKNFIDCCQNNFDYKKE
jgi:hypothetical protein